MAEGPGRKAIAAPLSPGVLLGEAARAFMLRPEATALTAVVALFVIFTVLSPDLFPTKETFISVMAVFTYRSAGRPEVAPRLRELVAVEGLTEEVRTSVLEVLYKLDNQTAVV